MNDGKEKESRGYDIQYQIKLIEDHSIWRVRDEIRSCFIIHSSKLVDLLDFSNDITNLKWPGLSKEELDDARGVNPFYSENVMATLVKIAVLERDWEQPLDESCLMLSSIDFDDLAQDTIMHGDKPVEILRCSKWFYRYPKVGKLVCTSTNSLLVEAQPSKQFPRTPKYFESPLPFPHPIDESIIQEAPPRNIWASTRFSDRQSHRSDSGQQASVSIIQQSFRVYRGFP